MPTVTERRPESPAPATAPPPNLDPGAVLADKANMDEPAVKQLLTPPTAKAGK